VAWSQPMQTFHGQSSPAAQDEPLYPTQPVARQWHLADLHRLATGKGVRVAVIDSGVEASHPDLAGQLQLNQNFVDGQALSAESHGTAVAGVIAARADNGLGIAGVAPGARLLALRACWQATAGPSSGTRCNTLSLAKALQAAIQERAQIINMSLSGPSDRLIGSLLDQALARGISVVAALGSASEPFPANHPGVLAAGPAPPLPPGVMLAPGREVPTTALGGGWTLVSGSSFSAAHLTGLLALMRELDGRPDLRAALVLEAGGRIDTCATLARFVKGARPACGLGGLGHTSE
jgi:subtilisin family serine protease